MLAGTCTARHRSAICKVLDAFIIERRHLQVKKIAETIDNTRTFELSVLAGVTNNAFSSVAAASNISGGLRGRMCEMPGFSEATLADHLHYNGLELTIGDVVLNRGIAAGKVVACACEHGCLFVLVDVWQHSRQLSEHSTVYRSAAARAVWAASSVEVPVAWYADGDELVVVV
jgi:hypothetical protein